MEHDIEKLNALLAEHAQRVKDLEAELDAIFDADLSRAALAEQASEILSLRKLAFLAFNMAEELSAKSGLFLADEFRAPFKIIEQQLKESLNEVPT